MKDLLCHAEVSPVGDGVTWSDLDFRKISLAAGQGMEQAGQVRGCCISPLL